MQYPLHIAFVSQDLCFGGTQRQMLELASRLDRAKFTPEIWTLTGPTDLECFAAEKNVPVVHLGAKRTPTLSFLYTLLREIRRRKPHILVPATAIPNIWCRIYGKCCAIPVLGTVRGGRGPKVQHEWLLWHLADQLMCNSTPLYDILRGLGVPAERLTYIANGVDMERYTPSTVPLGERAPLVLSVGRLVEDKNQQLLLRAFEHVIKAEPNARLRIVGDGELANTLHAIIAASPLLQNRAEICPASPDIRQHYHNARIFALSSIREGQPNVLLEAMASGLPAVSTNAGGACVDVIGDAGLISPQGNAIALAENIIHLLHNPDLCQDMGERGRVRVEKQFSFARMVSAHEELFLRMCNAKGN